MSNIQRKNRTLALTVDELLQTPRFKIAVERFSDDPMLMKAILIELGWHSLMVAKNKMISEYSKHSAFSRFELEPYLRSINDFTTFNIYFPMSKVEQLYYSADPKNKLSAEKRKELYEKIKNSRLGS